MDVRHKRLVELSLDKPSFFYLKNNDNDDDDVDDVNDDDNDYDDDNDFIITSQEP